MARHRDAMKCWPLLVLVQNGFKGDPKKIARTFCECFEVGGKAAHYESLFSTAEKDIATPGLIYYRWHWDLGKPGKGSVKFQVIDGDPPVGFASAGRMAFQVMVYGEPPLIRARNIIS